ncbi:hypothetical protein Pmani_000249 [Petrolisthes manimaculis]|uniref:Uncharacterized protein n=1 Tax=Petrolisthes manimaculis TaxID=1843537 RepID=A0AAE1QM23_9EUCA|nr:hypothetical protein Pmani_000249 [Petrolisthes manimaculis]
MVKPPPHSNRKGVNAALGIVEDTLSALQERVRQQETLKKDHVGTNTVPVSAGDSIYSTSDKHKKLLQPTYKETSVLVKRNLRSNKGRCKGQHDTHGDRQVKPHKRSDKTNKPDRDDTLTDREKAESVRGRNSKACPCRLKNKHTGCSRKRNYREKEALDDTSPVASTRGRRDRLPEKTQQGIAYPQGKSKSKKNGKKEAITSHHFAQPTLTSRLRGELVTQKERQGNKENIIKMPFIPCGSKGKSHHLGVLVQQQLGHLKTVPYNQLLTHAPPHLQASSTLQPLHTQVPHKCGQLEQKRKVKGSGESSSGEEAVTEEMVKRALNNLHHHLDQSAQDSQNP